MSVIVVGVSYRGAPLEKRERLAYSAADAAPLLAQLHGAGVEAVVLSTCNRTELYLWAPGADPVADVWAEFGRRVGSDVSQSGYVHRDRAAAAHLFRVAAGIDAMVLGEAQIQGQVHDAWQRARPYAGAVLNRLFQSAQLAAGRVRSETAIARGAASVSSAALQLARQIFGSLRGRRAMVLGAGDMAELALESFTTEGVVATTVANRTLERAEGLAARFGACARPFDDELWASLDQVDVLLCSTAAPAPVVTAARLATATAQRRRPLCILDIALPRDVEPAVRELDNVFLYDLDDLQSLVQESFERRRAELAPATKVIDAEVERFWNWVAGLSAVPTLTSLRAEAERIRHDELAAALRRMPELTDDERRAVEHLTRALMNKLLHAPSVRLRAAAANGRGLGVIDTARYLFGLDADADAYLSVPYAAEPQDPVAVGAAPDDPCIS